MPSDYASAAHVGLQQKRSCPCLRKTHPQTTWRGQVRAVGGGDLAAGGPGICNTTRSEQRFTQSGRPSAPSGAGACWAALPRHLQHRTLAAPASAALHGQHYKPYIDLQRKPQVCMTAKRTEWPTRPDRLCRQGRSCRRGRGPAGRRCWRPRHLQLR